MMYTQNFYDKYLKGSYTSANEILSLVSNYINPESIIDFGCGSGAWLKVSQKMFGSKILGVDQHDYNDINMLITEKEYIKHNLTEPLHLGEKFDLAISVEVAEHIDSKYADTFVDIMCNHSDVILFSAAVPNQGGTGHINEQPCSYWAEKFQKHGYYTMDCLRPLLWNNPNVEIWYINNVIIYVSEQKRHFFSNKNETLNFPLDIIHPKLFDKTVKKLTNKRY